MFIDQVESLSPSPILLSPDQEKALSSILSWYHSPNSPQTFSMGGYAGTGKTTIINSLCEQLDPSLRIAFVSLTGKAVKVMKDKIKSLPRDSISTIHSLIYRPIIHPEKGTIIGWELQEMSDPEHPPADPDQRLIPNYDLFINDEASMTDETLYHDLLSFGKKILFIGDHGQLPPVKGSFSLMAKPDIRLEKIHRQAEGNPIITLATMAREGKRILPHSYSSTVRVLTKSSLRDPSNIYINSLLESGDKNHIILVGTNRLRVTINKIILTALGHADNQPFPGAQIICLKNNRKEGLFNGMTAEVINLLPPDRFIIRLDDDREITTSYVPEVFLGEKSDPKPFEQRNLFDFSYAITCHKAQGSEFPRVFIWGEGFGSSELRRRWMYTAITRAQEELYIIK